MTALELKICLAVARDYSIDVSDGDMAVMSGFGLEDFNPVHVTIHTVARCLRWQCSCMDGSWDDQQFNKDRPHYLRNIQLSEFTKPEMEKLIVQFCTRRLEGKTVEEALAA